MVKAVLKYVVKDTDRHGNVRYYFRRGKQLKVRLHGDFGSREFMAAYHAALGGEAGPKKVPQKLDPTSFAYLCKTYCSSAEFSVLDRSTQKWRMRHLDAICDKYGSFSFKRIEPRHVRALRDQLREKPGASKTRLKALKALFAWAVEHGFVDRNPTRDVKPLRYEEVGHHTWTAEELEQFERFYPVGTKAQLAMSMLLYTACRREDVVKLGPQHIKDGRIKFTQAKNANRKPITIDIPLFPKLADAIRAIPSGHLSFLTTDYGKPFTPNGFGNKFREWCNAAGLPNCTAHGLRKAIATLLAQKGCSAHEIQSITGHVTLAEVERYTKAVERKKLSDAAMEKLRR